MRLKTIQIAKWRLLDNDHLLLDTTVKSGDKIFAPTWSIVRDVKDGTITPEQYTKVYRELMLSSWRDNKEHWLSIINEPKIVTLACYCKAGDFCHRHLLKEYFSKICSKYNYDFEYLGEVQ